MNSVGKNIRTLRTKRGLSLEELADNINSIFNSTINKGMISKWENDLTDPKLEHIRQIALFFNKSLDELLGLEEPKNIIVIESDEYTEKEMEEIRDFLAFIKSKRK